MSTPTVTVLLFQRTLHLWVLLFLLSALPVADLLWFDPIAPVLPYTGWRYHLVHPFGSVLPGSAAPLVLALALVLALRSLFRPSRWWSALLLWLSYTALMHLAFMASSGGQQLISNLLFWNILLSVQAPSIATWARPSAFWVIRLQLLLTYLATGLHKLTGTHWPDGTAMGIVATDHAFGPLWLADFPLLATAMTWAVLLFQFTFPIAVWWSRTRWPWMLFGVLFHLGTALWMGIPEMAFAFLVAYTIWLSSNEVERLRAWLPFKRSRSTASGPSAAVG